MGSIQMLTSTLNPDEFVQRPDKTVLIYREKIRGD